MDRWLNDSGGRMDGLSVRLSIQMYEREIPRRMARKCSKLKLNCWQRVEATGNEKIYCFFLYLPLYYILISN